MCAGGFIEELPPNGSSDRSRSTSSNDDVEIPGEFDNHRLNERISSLLMSSAIGGGGGGGLRPMDEDSDQSSTQDGSSASEFHSILFAFAHHFTFGYGTQFKFNLYIWKLGGQRSRRNRGRGRGHEMPNFENIMQEFLISISVCKFIFKLINTKPTKLMRFVVL